MLIPKIEKSTIDNVTREFLRSDTPYNYILDKISQLEEHCPELIDTINSLADRLYVHYDDSNEDDKLINKLRAVALTLVVVNCINTQIEIDWLKND